MLSPVCLGVNAAWTASLLRRAARYDRALRRPEAVQRGLLLRLVRRPADTAYGRRHGFASIRSVADFRSRVPLTTWDDYAADVARLAAGAAGVLTAAPVLRLVPSSGSSGARKLVPYTAALRAQFNAAIAPWIVDLYRRAPSLAAGPSYWSISPRLETPDEASAVPVGLDTDASYLGGAFRRLVARTFAVPQTVQDIADLDDFRYATLLHLCRARELRLISVWHPSFLALLLDRLPALHERMVRDLARTDRRRAREVARVDPARPSALWPRLGHVSCWADGHAAPAAAALARRLPGATVVPKGLIATEGVVSLPWRGGRPLAIRSHFLEFVDAAGGTALAHELDVGGAYAVVLTTAGGLYRYRLHDRVHVTGRVHRTPSIEFVGKEDAISDRCGEKLSEAFVAGVLRRQLRRHGIEPPFAMLAPEVEPAPPRYALFVETKGGVPPGLADDLERELRENPHYRWCVELGQLAPSIVVPTAGGAYERYAETLHRRGVRLGDVKPSALSPDAGWRSILAPA